jgi:hypothetical protein
MNSNNNTIKKNYNKVDQPFSEKYLNDLNIMNAYNMKAYNNIGPKISQCNIRKNIKVNNKDDVNQTHILQHIIDYLRIVKQG